METKKETNTFLTSYKEKCLSLNETKFSLDRKLKQNDAYYIQLKISV